MIVEVVGFFTSNSMFGKIGFYYFFWNQCSFYIILTLSAISQGFEVNQDKSSIISAFFLPI